MLCSRFIGLDYELGADGTGNAIDCIHLVLGVLDDLNIKRPAMDPTWYKGNRYKIGRDLADWGRRIEVPSYDGDIIVWTDRLFAFGVIWSQGILAISDQTRKVAWFPLRAVSLTDARFYRTRNSSQNCLASLSKNMCASAKS
jgi:hypothetical protein